MVDGGREPRPDQPAEESPDLAELADFSDDKVDLQRMKANLTARLASGEDRDAVLAALSIIEHKLNARDNPSLEAAEVFAPDTEQSDDDIFWNIIEKSTGEKRPGS